MNNEIYEKTAEMLKDKGYQILLLNFRDPQEGNCWNPMTLPYKMYKEGNQDKAIELLDDLAANILYEENDTSKEYPEEKNININPEDKQEIKNENNLTNLIDTKKEKELIKINNQIETVNNIQIINKEKKEANLNQLNLGNLAMKLSMIKIEKQDELNIEKNINQNKSNITIPIDYKNIHLLATLSLMVDKVEETHDENKNV